MFARLMALVASCILTLFCAAAMAAQPAEAKKATDKTPAPPPKAMLKKAVAKAHMAVVVVDIQSDFTTAREGTLAVPGADDKYLEAVSRATRRFKQAGFPVYATMDWHPADHMSFASNHPGKKPFEMITLPDGRQQMLWPNHCVAGTAGAGLLVNKSWLTDTVKKGMDPKYDSYSGFKDDGGKPTGLDDLLRKKGIKRLLVYGLATDYCVKATAMDGVKAGYKVAVIERLSRGVDPKTTQAAIEEMKKAGVKIWTAEDRKKMAEKWRGAKKTGPAKPAKPAPQGQKS